jgi:formylglycine-generating enzyme required for sulfatase activity
MSSVKFKSIYQAFIVLSIVALLNDCGGEGSEGWIGAESTYELSGTITKSGGVALQGVTITLSGTGSGTTATDASGNYGFTGLANGSYTLTPTLAGNMFSPVSKAVTINGANATSISFTLDLNDPITSLLNSMVSIPDGTFMMGSTDNEYKLVYNTTPVHMVTLQAFEIGAYEVTQAQYLAVMDTNPSSFQGTSYLGHENNPVEQVSWYEAREFCTKLSAQTGRTFRLPSEAQWEYACRAGSTTLYSFGDDDALLSDYAWWSYNSEGTGGPHGTHPVGTKLPNPWVLYDMNGNVWEWCLDSWHLNYIGAPTDGSAWEPETGTYRHIRGGGWSGDLWFCRSADRSFGAGPDSRGDNLGFRIVAIP